MIELLKSPLFLQYIQIFLGIASIGFTIRIYVKQTKLELEKIAQSVQMKEGFGRLERHLSNLEDYQDLTNDEVRNLRDKVVALEVRVAHLETENKYLKTKLE